jgi:hypothetical protein
MFVTGIPEGFFTPDVDAQPEMKPARAKPATGKVYLDRFINQFKWFD